MADNIKSLLNDIIAGGSENGPHVSQDTTSNVTFNKDDVKEKLAFGIIKDMTKAMMHDEKLSDEKMLDDSIIDHVKNDYKGTCFGYLNDAQKRLKSPLLADVIQEIEEYAIMEEADFNEKGYVSDNHKIDSDILKDNPDYKTFRKKLTEETSNMVVNDVANEVLKTKETPVFDIDDKIKPVTNETAPTDESLNVSEEDVTDDTGEGPSTVSEDEQELPTAPVEDFNNPVSESAIINMTGTIVAESYANGNPMTTEQGMEKAICEYCVQQLCFLFKDTSRSPFDKLLR